MPIRTARADDLPAVVALLTNAGLPYQDLTPGHLDHFLIAQNGEAVAGIVGLERCGSDALLRSLVVHPESRFTGLGSQLVTAAEDRARRAGTGALYLLTTTAAEFFSRRGYQAMARSAAPAALQNTSEFSSLCPSQAVCMRRTLNP